ncbi:MAG: hypothetical protein AB8H47_01895 [Bacteroidia bacterium]
MDGIEVIKDPQGNVTQIRMDVAGQPDLASDVYHLLSALQRAKVTEDAQQKRSPNGHKPLSVSAFNRLIRDAKASGEVTEAEFFNAHPKWQKKERLS